MQTENGQGVEQSYVPEITPSYNIFIIHIIKWPCITWYYSTCPLDFIPHPKSARDLDLRMSIYTLITVYLGVLSLYDTIKLGALEQLATIINTTV